MTARVLCVGRIYCDLVFSGMATLPRAGQETYAENLSIFAGGGAYITGAYLAAAGVKTSLCGVIPNGPFGDGIRAEMAASGLDLRPCQQAGAGEQPQVTVVISTRKDRAFLTRRTGAALPENFAEVIKQGGFTHLHIAELATLLEHPRLISLAKDIGLTISLDCAWDEAAMQAASGLSMLKKIDLFLPNEPEVLKITGTKSIALAQRSITKTVPIVVVKRGALGAMYWGPEGEFASALTDETAVIDPTGAGDAFNAGFLVCWLAQAAPMVCLENGNRFGKAAVGHLGGAAAAKILP